MEPRPITDKELADNPGMVKLTMKAPTSLEDNVQDVEVLMVDPNDTNPEQYPHTKIPFVFTHDELLRVVFGGGTVWLTVLGFGMQPVSLEVDSGTPQDGTALDAELDRRSDYLQGDKVVINDGEIGEISDWGNGGVWINTLDGTTRICTFVDFFNIDSAIRLARAERGE